MLFPIFFVILAFILFFSSVKIVKQSTVAMVERLGKFNRQMDAGLRIIIPGIDKISTRVNLRTLVLDTPAQDVITRDNVGVKINTVVWYRVTDPFKAVYEIDNLKEAVINIIATTLRDTIGSMELDETYASRDRINAQLRGALDESTTNWGVRIERVEVKDIDPPRDIRESMEKQMRAERERREQVLRAQGIKEAQILEAQGEKEAAILKADAQRETQIRTANGEAEAIRLIAEAESEKISRIYEAYNNVNLSSQVLNLESIKALSKLAESDNKMLVPYDAVSLMGSVSSLKQFANFDKK